MVANIVVDTNVLVSALISASGDSRSVIRLCLQKKCQPIIGNTLFAEYESLLNREEIIAKCPLNSDQIQSFLAAFLSVCQWVSVYYLWRPNLKDEGDNHLVELAIAGNAEIIVTNNTKDFQNAELLFPDLSILKPEDFIRR